MSARLFNKSVHLQQQDCQLENNDGKFYYANSLTQNKQKAEQTLAATTENRMWSGVVCARQ